MILKVTVLLLLTQILFPFLITNTQFARASTSARTPNFWLLAIEVLREYQERDGQRLISELLQYQNWNNSTEYTSHIHLLSEYRSEEVSDEIKPCLVGNPSKSNAQREITDFLGQAIPGDVVVVYIMCHGSPNYFYGIFASHEEVNDWLSLGNLPLCYVTVITESCSSGASIQDGKGGILGPNHNVLCGCMSNESCSGWAGEGNYMFFSHLINEGFSLGEDCDNDGWISAKEAFTYAKPITEQWIWDAFHWDQRPVSYYGQVDGNVPLVQRDTTKAMPDLPPLIVVLSPQNMTYTKIFVPALIAASETLSWMGYSLDGMPNVTMVGSVLLSGLTDGSHNIIFYGRDASGNDGSSLRVFFSVKIMFVHVCMDYQPDVMKLNSVGKLLFVCVEPSEAFNLSEVDVSSLRLNGTISPESESVRTEDYDGDTVPELVMTFNWTEISELALSEHIMHGNLVLALDGQLCDGTSFEGSDAVIVRMPGDVCIDGKVDMRDISMAANAFGCCLGQSRWNAVADENEDNRIDLRDIGLIARHFGENYPIARCSISSSMVIFL